MSKRQAIASLSLLFLSHPHLIAADDFAFRPGNLPAFRSPWVKILDDNIPFKGLGPFSGLVFRPSLKAENILRARLMDTMHPFFALKEIPSVTADSFGLTDSSIHSLREYSITYRDVDVCGAYLREHHLSGNGVLLHGRIPEGSADVISTEWPAKENVIAAVADRFEQFYGFLQEEPQLISAKPCLISREGALMPGYSMVIHFNGVPYQVDASEEIITRFEIAQFDATATVSIYDTNTVTGSLVDRTITIDGSGALKNDYFQTSPVGSTAISGGSYQVSSTDSQYGELATFVNTNLHYTFTESNGFTWYGAKPLVIRAGDTFDSSNRPTGATSGTKNNALYVPGSSNADGKPGIYVGTGDGSILKNLTTDTDVVSHEFGHHVIYSALTSTSGESLVLHEGLADTLTFLRTGDNCLGESICPTGSTACVKTAQCLRTGGLAASTLSYQNTLYNQYETHKKGQLISGLVWDLRASSAIPSNVLPQFMIRSIALLLKDSGIEDLIYAMLLVDKNYYSSAYGQKIIDAANARGLSQFTAGIDPSDPSTLRSPKGGGSTITSGDTSESKKKSGFFGCTVAQQRGDFIDFFFALLLLPLLFAVPKRVLLPRRVRSTRDNSKRY